MAELDIKALRALTTTYFPDLTVGEIGRVLDALPALLDAAEERDALREALRNYRDQHESRETRFPCLSVVRRWDHSTNPSVELDPMDDRCPCCRQADALLPEKG